MKMDRLHKAIEKFGPVNAFMKHCDGNVAVMRIGQKVIKLPKVLSRPHELREIARESKRSELFAPTEFDEENGWLVQPYIKGRHSTREERNEVVRQLRAAGIKWIQDLARDNVIITDEGKAVIVDFRVNGYVKFRLDGTREPRRKLGLPRASARKVGR